MGIPERLADATPWVVIDVVVLAFAFLVLTRVFGLVAPRLARSLTRRGFALGLPLVLVVSVVGHVAAPEAALALSDGIGFTAFVVGLLLGGVWLLALLYRLARRLATGRDPQHRALTRGAEWRRVAAAMLPVAMLVALVQWDAANDEVKATGQRARDLRSVIRALEATEKRSAEFARERGLLSEKLELLHAITPRAPDVAELASGLAARAGEYGIRVVDWSSTMGETRGVLQEHQLSLVLDGKLERLKELVERTRKMSRLVSWQRITVRSGKATALVSSYCAREVEAKPPGRDACVHPRGKVWLWPYTAKVRAARAEVDGLCAQRARLDKTRAQVDDFQAKRRRLEDLVLAIERVREGWRVPEIVIEEEPPAEATPLPSQRT